MLDDLGKKMPKVKPSLDFEEVIEGQDILETIECIICKQISIDPVQCSGCDVIFCQSCKDEHKDRSVVLARDKCPMCKQRDTRIGPMNKNLKKLTLEKLVFMHQCIKPEKKPELTALEKFKFTDKYKEIQARLKGNQLPEESSLANLNKREQK